MSHDDHAVHVERAMSARGKTKQYHSAHNFATRVMFGTKASVHDDKLGRAVKIFVGLSPKLYYKQKSKWALKQWLSMGRQSTHNSTTKVCLLLQHSQLRHQGEFWYVHVSAWWHSWQCSQKLCGPFLRAVLLTNVKRWWSWEDKSTHNSTTKVNVQHQKYTFGSGHNNDHIGVVRIFVGHSWM